METQNQTFNQQEKINDVDTIGEFQYANHIPIELIESESNLSNHELNFQNCATQRLKKRFKRPRRLSQIKKMTLSSQLLELAEACEEQETKKQNQQYMDYPMSQGTNDYLSDFNSQSKIEDITHTDESLLKQREERLIDQLEEIKEIEELIGEDEEEQDLEEKTENKNLRILPDWMTPNKGMNNFFNVVFLLNLLPHL